MLLTMAQIEAAILYNQRHAADVLPAIERMLGRAVPLPGQGQWHSDAVSCLAKLQHQAKLDADGQFGPGSRIALVDQLHAYPAQGLWPSEGADERKHWTSLCEVMGYLLTADRHGLIGLRGVSLNASFTHPSASRAAYDDTFVWLDRDGSVRRFPGS